MSVDEMLAADVEPSDRSLLFRFQRGNGDAATRLYLRYADRLLALASKQCSRDLLSRVSPEDIVQSVFRTFFRRAARGSYEVPAGEELWKLFLVISLNKIRSLGSFHRAQRRDVKLTTAGAGFERALLVESGHDEQALAILRMVVDDALADLPATHRDIVSLRIEGHEVDEVSRRTGRAKRSVERVLQEFRKRLAALLELE